MHIYPTPNTQIGGQSEAGVCGMGAGSPEWDPVQDEGVAGPRQGQSRKQAGGKPGAVQGLRKDLLGIVTASAETPTKWNHLQNGHQLNLPPAMSALLPSTSQQHVGAEPILVYPVWCECNSSLTLLPFPQVELTNEAEYLFILCWPLIF